MNSIIYFLDAPVVLTLPHMMDIDSRYSSLIDGQHPDPEKHQIYIDIEPVSIFI